MVFSLKKHIYFVISQGRLKATELESGNSLEESLATVVHPRTPIGNFDNLETIFSRAIKELVPKNFFLASPCIYLHLLDEVDGGYTQIEIRAFKEAALGAGAREVHMPDSRTLLTAEQLLAKEFRELDDSF